METEKLTEFQQSAVLCVVGELRSDIKTEKVSTETDRKNKSI